MKIIAVVLADLGISKIRLVDLYIYVFSSSYIKIWRITENKIHKIQNKENTKYIKYKNTEERNKLEQSPRKILHCLLPARGQKSLKLHDLVWPILYDKRGVFCNDFLAGKMLNILWNFHNLFFYLFWVQYSLYHRLWGTTFQSRPNSHTAKCNSESEDEQQE